MDSGGPEDVPAQDDLTQMGRDDSNASVYSLFWSWNATDFTSQAGNACALFDTNGNGNIDFAVCAEIENVPHGNTSVVEQSSISPIAVECGDSKPDRCTMPKPVSFTSAQVKSGTLQTLAASPPANLITETDPFKADKNFPKDSSIRLEIAKSFLPKGAVLVNVCSYPSLGNDGNNNPFDCIVNPGGGFLNIVKVAPNGTTQEFKFTVNPGSITKSITGAGETGAFPLPFGTGYSVAEEQVTGWELQKATCALEGGAATGTKNGNKVESVTVQSGKITTCTFTNFKPEPKLGLTKTDNLNPLKFMTVGQEVTYTLTATNEGNTTLHNVEVTDEPALKEFKCTPKTPVGELAPGKTVVCTGKYAITQADLDSGFFEDTAKAKSTETTAEATDTITADQKAKLGLTKKDNLNPAKYDHVGQEVEYTLTATNEGDTTLHKVEVTDEPTLKEFKCTPTTPVAELAPGKTVVCTGKYAITQADLDKGSFEDTAKAKSTETTAEATDTITADQKAKLGLTKKASPTTYSAAGQIIEYTLVATNEGNVTLKEVTVSDPKLGTLTCTPKIPVKELAPKGTISCKGSYTIQPGDIKSPPTGEVKNTATAEGLDPNGNSVSAQAKATVKQVGGTGQIAPTATTCEQFKNGTAENLSQELYGVKANKISSVAPGVFFYYSKITAATSKFTIEVTQENTLGWKTFETKQIILWNEKCEKVSGNEVSGTSGLATLKVTGLTPGATYYVSVKYETKSLVGQSVPGKPTNVYTFLTSLSGAKVTSSKASLTVKPS